uniref:Uncharacterized protein n=1 Tax=Compsopogon caeruleus TaxID=31354 RepID=A0A7S1TBV6_9RHOD|mmetsp:Transcript_13577/g.27785  ORF Transcript_13577/g.27785 Transcript_13577/m.27785 type:complete len:141 (+) Transcript_13577:168-590(+)
MEGVGFLCGSWRVGSRSERVSGRLCGRKMVRGSGSLQMMVMPAAQRQLIAICMASMALIVAGFQEEKKRSRKDKEEGAPGATQPNRKRAGEARRSPEGNRASAVAGSVDRPTTGTAAVFTPAHRRKGPIMVFRTRSPSTS